MGPSAVGKKRPSAILMIIANLLLPLSILVFGIGFFPYKPLLPGLARYETLNYGHPPNAPFDKLVFMVVDALRRSILIIHETGRNRSKIADNIIVTSFSRKSQGLHTRKGNSIHFLSEHSLKYLLIASSNVASSVTALPCPSRQMPGPRQ